MQRYTVYVYLETALHVSGGKSTHHQERIQLYLQHLVFVTPLLLPAAKLCKVASCWILGLQNFLRDKLLTWTNNCSCVEDTWKNFKDILFEGIKHFAPHKILKQNPDPDY